MIVQQLYHLIVVIIQQQGGLAVDNFQLITLAKVTMKHVCSLYC